MDSISEAESVEDIISASSFPCEGTDVKDVFCNVCLSYQLITLSYAYVLLYCCHHSIATVMLFLFLYIIIYFDHAAVYALYISVCMLTHWMLSVCN